VSGRAAVAGIPQKGFDGHKKVKGRKRHIVIDTTGCVLTVLVDAANIHDSKAARQVLLRLFEQAYERLTIVIGDSAYGRKLSKWAKKEFRLLVTVIKRTELNRFEVIPMRWKVERTFAWMNWNECDCASAESFIYVFNIARILRHF
jgi:putative transposase